MMLAIILVLYAVVFLTDFRLSLKNGKLGEKALYLGLMALSFSVLVLNELGVDIPSPAKPIEAAVHALFGI